MTENNPIEPKVSDKDEQTSAQKKAAEAVKTDKINFPYISASSCNLMDTLVPTKLAIETYDALRQFIDNGIDTAVYVQEKLQYTSRLAVANAFGAEQVDAIALAIKQIEVGKGFILGDMAGIGKGRVCAGIMRYAHLIGKTPIFITYQPNLFSDMYRDLGNIGGFGQGKSVPVPLILNSREGADDPSIILAAKDGEDEETILFPALKTKEIIEICKKNHLPKKVDMVMFTYSQLSFDDEKTGTRTENAKIKFSFLEAIADNCIFVMDESHKGSGDSNTTVNLTKLISKSHGCMFASATYSKTPSAMKFYIPKTDIADSDIDPNVIEKAIVKNGEVVQEYIASMLVSSGQMVRRARSYEGLDIDYIYEKKSDAIKEAFNKYDMLIALHNKIGVFSSSALMRDAINNLLRKHADDLQIEIKIKGRKWKSDEPNKDKEATKHADWEKANKNKYYARINNERLLKNRFQWIENLLFSIKAEYVGRMALDSLHPDNAKETENYHNGKTYTTVDNRKPVIAIRSTNESSIRDLGYKAGDIIKKEDNDFSRTLLNVLGSLMSGTITFEPIVKKNKEAILVEDAEVTLDLFADGGEKYLEIKKEVFEMLSGLPISPIDKIIDMIQNTVRPREQTIFTSHKTYLVDEVTKRSLRIVQNGDAYEVVAVQKERKSVKVDRFNNGKSDVIILNTAGSTGLSIHSSAEASVRDRRPRMMIIHQVELDVNEEVQKRGRVNRTGQINQPAYRYVVSPIPSEIRKLMMLRKKLRSLDANTTGNVTQSAKATQILDPEGNEIEDIYNKYGFEVLTENLLSNTDFEKFKPLLPEEDKSQQKWYMSGAGDADKMDDFARGLEVYSSSDQLDFYNTMNIQFVKKKEYLIEKDEFDLETTIEKLDVITNNKMLLYKGNETNPFNQSVFIEDKHSNSRVKLYTKQEVQDKLRELGNGENYKLYYDEIKKEFFDYAELQPQKIIDAHPVPVIEDSATQEERDEILENHRIMLDEILEREELRLNYVRDCFLTFVPNRNFYLVAVVECLEDSTIPYTYVPAKFLGYRIGKHSTNKFTGGNIDLYFAGIKRSMPKLRINLAQNSREYLLWIRQNPVTANKDVDALDQWITDKDNNRVNMRVITGEIFKGFELAYLERENDKNYKDTPRLIKYTTQSGAIESGIRLQQNTTKLLTEDHAGQMVAISDARFIDYLKNQGNYVFPNLNDSIHYSNSNSSFELRINTGQDYRRSEKSKEGFKKSFLSEFATTADTQEIKRITGKSFNADTRDYYSELTRKYAYNRLFFIWTLNADQLQEALKFFFKKTNAYVSIGAKSFVVIRNDDTFDTNADNRGGKSGAYQYYPLFEVKTGSEPPNFVSMEKSDQNPYGIVTVRFPLTPFEARSYYMIPVNPSPSLVIDTIKKAIKSDSEWVEYKAEVKALQEDYTGIELLTESKIGGFPLKYLIGRAKNGGKIISDNIELDTTKQEDVPTTTEQEEHTTELIPLDFDSAQDFLIKLKTI